MNNRWRQKNKAFYRYILHTSQMVSSEIPYEAMSEAKKAINQIAAAIVKDLKLMQCASPVIWSKPIPQLVVHGTIDSEVKL